MSKSRRVFVGVVLVLSVVGLTACAKAPTDAINQAQSALQAAGDAEAATYAPEAWEAAQDALNAAQAEVEAQNAKFALTRSYKNATALLATAQEAAATAQEAAVAGKEQMQADVESAIATIEADLGTADGLLADLAKCRRRPKGFASDLEMMRGNVDGLRSQLVDVQTAEDEGNYFEANSMADGLLEGLGATIQDLENVKAKLGC
jgi:chromosome segregation ATPase